MSAFASHPGVETMHDRVLVVGADHLLDGDDGVGAYVVSMLRESTWPGNVGFVDAGGGGFHLLELLRSVPRAILIDAVSDGLWPGSVTRHHVTGPVDIPPSLAARDTGLRDLLASLTTLEAMPEFDVITISVDEMSLRQGEISPEVQAALPEVRRVVRELAH